MQCNAGTYSAGGAASCLTMSTYPGGWAAVTTRADGMLFFATYSGGIVASISASNTGGTPSTWSTHGVGACLALAFDRTGSLYAGSLSGTVSLVTASASPQVIFNPSSAAFYGMVSAVAGARQVTAGTMAFTVAAWCWLLRSGDRCAQQHLGRR